MHVFALVYYLGIWGVEYRGELVCITPLTLIASRVVHLQLYRAYLSTSLEHPSGLPEVTASEEAKVAMACLLKKQPKPWEVRSSMHPLQNRYPHWACVPSQYECIKYKYEAIVHIFLPHHLLLGKGALCPRLSL